MADLVPDGIDQTTGQKRPVAASDNLINTSGSSLSGAMTLIERKEFTAEATTATFSGLDGNTDGVYVIQSYLTLGGVAGNTAWKLHPNGLSTNQVATRVDLTNTYARNAPYDRHELGFNNALGQFSYSTTHIWARATGPGGTPLERAFTTRHLWSPNPDMYLHHTKWTDTSTNITSLVIFSTATNGIGVGSTIALYKLAI